MRGTTGSAMSCECGWSSRAVVLEDEDVAEPPILPQVEHTLAISPEDPLNRHGRQRGQGRVVLGRLDDHLVGADAVHLVEQALALSVEPTFHLQRRELVRHHTHVPPGTVRRRAVAAIRQHFARRVLLVALAERAYDAGERRDVLETKRARALATLRGDNHPPARNRVFA
jgi:hypothetical protein